ncbi:flippase [Marinomonas sp. NPDC078689]|uniref:flippase n=1 Tax=Marinomonas sp. NPDC078689 TaxID=3364147 RepID=UPI0037C5BDDF
MTAKKHFIRNYLGLGTIRVLNIPLSIVISVILARSLGPEGFGQYSFVMALIPLLALPVNGGLPKLLTREIAGFVQQEKWGLYRGMMRTAFVWVVSLAVLLVCVIWAIAYFTDAMAEGSKWRLLPIAILMIPVIGFNAVRSGTVKGLGLPFYSEVPVTIVQPCFLLLTLASLLFYQVLDPLHAVWAQVISYGATFVVSSWLFLKVQPSISRLHRPIYTRAKWARSLLPFTVLALVNTFNTKIGIFLLGMFSADEQVAAMRVAERGGQFVTLSLTIVNLIIAPQIVRAFRDNNTSLLQKLAKQSARGGLLVALPIAAVLVFFGEFIIRVVFGESYLDITYGPMVILIIGQLVNVFFGSLAYLLTMSGHEKDTLKGQVVAVISNVLMCSILIPMYGAVGAAISVSISLVISNFLLARLVFIRLKVVPGAI